MASGGTGLSGGAGVGAGAGAGCGPGGGGAGSGFGSVFASVVAGELLPPATTAAVTPPPTSTIAPSAIHSPFLEPLVAGAVTCPAVCVAGAAVAIGWRAQLAGGVDDHPPVDGARPGPSWRDRGPTALGRQLRGRCWSATLIACADANRCSGCLRERGEDHVLDAGGHVAAQRARRRRRRLDVLAQQVEQRVGDERLARVAHSNRITPIA